MTIARIFLFGSFILFGVIGFAAWKKKGKLPENIPTQVVEVPILAPPLAVETPSFAPTVQAPILPTAPIETEPEIALDDIPEVDRIDRLFSLDASYRLPIVETVAFTSRVPWLKERPAWVADYASHFETSRHFIARCLNHKPDYFTQKVTPGARFNVFRKDKNIQFYLLADLSRCRMLFYYIDQGEGERVLLKTYRIAVGREDSSQESGYLTPIGKYSLGDKVAIYKPGTMGYFREQKIEMIRIFGTRWLPFDKEIEGCTKNAKGFGLHGAPWITDPATGELVEDRSKIGKCDSDGSIWFLSEDIDEIFAIVLTKPTIVEIVKDFRDAKLPGVEPQFIDGSQKRHL